MTRARVGLLAAYWLAAGLVAGEIGCRLYDEARFASGLGRFPRIQARYEGSKAVMPRISFGSLVGPPGSQPAPVYPPGSTGMDAPRWTTFGDFPASGFRKPPARPDPTPGVVRIAFVGGSTTFDGYPELVQERMDERFGAGRVEVLNLGVPASSIVTSLVLVERFFPRFRPHLTVVYHGFNDLVRQNARKLARISMSRGGFALDRDISTALDDGYGLWGRLRRIADPSVFREDLWYASPARAPRETIAFYWNLSRTVWSLGGELLASTFAHPDRASLSSEDRDFFDADIRYLWPLLGSGARYGRDIADYNVAVRDFARAARAPLVDVEAAVGGGRDRFRDSCHLETEAKGIQAAAAFALLAPRVAALLAAGAPPPAPRAPPAISARDRPASMPTVHPGDGRCEPGPCPAGSCFVPAGDGIFGYGEAPIRRYHDAMKAGLGDADMQWMEDDGPPVPVSISALCVDETEANRSDHARCVDAGVCPPIDALEPTDSPAPSAPPAGAGSLPAVMPTAIDAERYCAFKGARLPTDVEWEVVARGGDGRAMPWGDSPWSGAEANFRGGEWGGGAGAGPSDGHAGPAPPGSFTPRGPFGQVDMAGNLWEWVRDCLVFDAHEILGAGARDPEFPNEPGCRRLVRGGSFVSFSGILERRTAEGTFDVEPHTFGVRCVRDFGTVHRRFSGRK